MSDRRVNRLLNSMGLREFDDIESCVGEVLREVEIPAVRQRLLEIDLQVACEHCFRIVASGIAKSLGHLSVAAAATALLAGKDFAVAHLAFAAGPATARKVEEAIREHWVGMHPSHSAELAIARRELKERIELVVLQNTMRFQPGDPT